MSVPSASIQSLISANPPLVVCCGLMKLTYRLPGFLYSDVRLEETRHIRIKPKSALSNGFDWAKLSYYEVKIRQSIS